MFLFTKLQNTKNYRKINIPFLYRRNIDVSEGEAGGTPKHAADCESAVVLGYREVSEGTTGRAPKHAADDIADALAHPSEITKTMCDFLILLLFILFQFLFGDQKRITTIRGI